MSNQTKNLASRVYIDYKWLRLVSRRLVEIEGKHYTHEIWVDAKGKSTEEYVPRDRLYEHKGRPLGQR